VACRAWARARAPERCAGDVPEEEPQLGVGDVLAEWREDGGGALYKTQTTAGLGVVVDMVRGVVGERECVLWEEDGRVEECPCHSVSRDVDACTCKRDSPH